MSVCKDCEQEIVADSRGHYPPEPFYCMDCYEEIRIAKCDDAFDKRHDL